MRLAGPGIFGTGIARIAHLSEQLRRLAGFLRCLKGGGAGNDSAPDELLGLVSLLEEGGEGVVPCLDEGLAGGVGQLKGLGESSPMMEGRDSRAMERNRRVELELIP